MAISNDGNTLSLPMVFAMTWSSEVLAMKSSASVRLGAAPVSQVPVLTACVPASGRSRFEITVTASRNGSSGLMIGLNSKPTPVVGGFQ